MLRRKKRSEHPLLHTVEEATQLLRRCDAGTWAWWLVGSAPFAIGLLHFISDMSRAATAAERLPGAALLLALLYWWMKIAHAVFSDRLLRQLRGDTDPAPLTLRAKLRFITSQGLIHCTAPWVLPLSIAAMLPFGWVYAGYHNASVLALSIFRKGGRTRDLIRTALVQSNYRQGQNHGLLVILMAFSGIVWLNWLAGTMLAATLAKMFSGSENAISRNPMMMLGTVVVTATFTASYLVVGPLVKALYVLRCFYSLSRKNGEDIDVAFRASAVPVAALIATLWLGGSSLSMGQAPVNNPPPPPVLSSVDPKALDQHIRQVLKQDVFQWRMPRDPTKPKPGDEKGWFESFLDDIRRWLKSASDAVGNAFDHWITDKLKQMIKGLLGARPTISDGSMATPWADAAQLILKGLLAILGLLLAVLLIRQWRRLPPVVAQAALPEVNLESDQVVATQLPENEWLRLAEEKINSGEFRLAMRALFLATLAHLGERKLLGIVRSKSNGDYVRELSLRARDRQDLRGRFGNSVKVFDWAWYGWHEVTRELLDQFRDNHQHIINDGRAN